MHRAAKKIPYFLFQSIFFILCYLLQQNVIAKGNCSNPFELSTQGSHIIDQCGNKFKLKSVNWYGAHDKAEVVGGLDKQPLKNIVKLIKDGGFNSVRLPFSNQMLHHTNLLDAKYLKANPELLFKTPLEVFDAVVNALTDAGIVVILNNHTTISQWCCRFDYNGLWHHPHFQSTDQWINDWTMLAKRYQNNPLVAGADLRNEVRTARFHSTILPVYPNWGNGDDNDWKLAATQAANAIHSINPHMLIVVEGINWKGTPMINGYRPVLIPVKDNPITLNIPNKLVYEAHIYSYTGPKHTGEESSSLGHTRYREMNEETLRATLDEEFGYVLEEGHNYTAPVWLGEFGADTNAGEAEQIWFKRMVDYLIEKDMGWAIWPLNPENTPDGYGLLNADWTAYHKDWRTELIQKLLQA